MKLTINRSIFYLLIILLAISFTFSNVAIAAEKIDKASKRAVLMIQKMKQDMEAEKAAMQTQFDIQKKEFEDKLKTKEGELTIANKKLAKAVRKNKVLEADLKKMKLDKEAVDEKLLQTQARLETTQKSLDDLKVQYQQAQADLKFNDNQRKTLTNNLSKANKAVDECQLKNTKLHQFGTELINIYDNPSTYEAAMRKEQFFQLKRVELENTLQDYQDKVDDARFVNKK
jgi:chromosome segregation ATPase